MARKRRAKLRKPQAPPPGWWASLDGRKRRRVILSCVIPAFALVVLYAGSLAMGRVEALVERMLVDRANPTLAFVDLPPKLAELAEGDLRASVADLLERNWTDDQLCRDLAERFAAVGWVAKVSYVRRTGDAHFEVSCRYRLPFAMVQQSSEFFLVDADGVRLPGAYRYDPSWQLVQGVAQPAPSPGVKWEGEDLQAGLTIIEALAHEPFVRQTTAVLVRNFGGRSDPGTSHLELATDRAGGRIRWGSAPGHELEENVVEQKLAILRENYQRTGRVDAEHPVIDISVFPDRFTIPG